MTPEEIELLFKRTDGIVPPASGHDGEATLTEDERQYRIAHLRAVLLEAHNAWVSGSEDLDRIAEKLGDGSRHREPPPPHLSFSPPLSFVLFGFCRDNPADVFPQPSGGLLSVLLVSWASSWASYPRLA